MLYKTIDVHADDNFRISFTHSSSYIFHSFLLTPSSPQVHPIIANPIIALSPDHHRSTNAAPPGPLSDPGASVHEPSGAPILSPPHPPHHPAPDLLPQGAHTLTLSAPPHTSHSSPSPHAFPTTQASDDDDDDDSSDGSPSPPHPHGPLSPHPRRCTRRVMTSASLLWCGVCTSTTCYPPCVPPGTTPTTVQVRPWMCCVCRWEGWGGGLGHAEVTL